MEENPARTAGQTEGGTASNVVSQESSESGGKDTATIPVRSKPAEDRSLSFGHMGCACTRVYTQFNPNKFKLPGRYEHHPAHGWKEIVEDHVLPSCERLSFSLSHAYFLNLDASRHYISSKLTTS
jgi:hypothetical protein